MLFFGFHWCFSLFLTLGIPPTLSGQECNSSFHDSHKRQEIFLKEDNHSLDVSVVATQIARDIFECIFKCLRNPFCLSLNVAAFKDATGQLRCDLLSSDKHRNPDDFKSNDSSHYLFIKSECLSSPCQNRGKCVPDYKRHRFHCNCTDGFKGKYCEKVQKVHKSCKDVYNSLRSSVSNIVVALDLDSQQISVLCHMGDFGCGEGGWTPVMKIDGKKSTFHYDSNLWSNNETFNVDGGLTGFDSVETKLSTYWNTPFSTICLGMKVGQNLSFIKINKTADSLMSLIADGKHRDTFLGRNTWKKLIGSQASLQYNCNMEGFNVVGAARQWSRARIGILGNNENDCGNCDSRIGFGTGGKHDNSSTCGNEALNNPADNGARHIKVMGFILIQ
ncbi:uncharacterized protein [Acropora muricata]|uniref:uncharacterized protein isoform X2 n=1 Tax=Acropora muricata TaxID=159855 RepID=UPI0034E3A658